MTRFRAGENRWYSSACWSTETSGRRGVSSLAASWASVIFVGIQPVPARLRKAGRGCQWRETHSEKYSNNMLACECAAVRTFPATVQQLYSVATEGRSDSFGNRRRLQ